MLEVNAPLIEEQGRYRTLPEPELAEEVAARTFTAAASLVAVSEEVADYLRTRPETAGRVHVVGNGVSAERFGSINRRPLSYNDVFTIGFVGSLKPWHGVETLIDAFAHVSLAFPDVRLQIVGDGPERAALQKRVEQQMPSRIDMVEFLGAVDHDHVPELLASMDVAVAPYPKLDGFYFSPLKIYEYMAAGCAVIASRIGAPARIISSGVNGLLFEPGNVDGLTATLRMLYCNRGLSRELGNAARREVLRQQAWKHVLEAIVATTATGTRKPLTEVAT